MPVDLESPYCEEKDLLVGDIRSPLDKIRFIEMAADEIDSKLGFVYNLPLHWETETEVPAHEATLLKSINARLATGRFLLAAFTSGENIQMHAYGANLIKESLNDLMCLANGDVDLSSDVTTNPSNTAENLLPGIVNYDEESLLLGFENTVMAGKPWYSRPGAKPIWP